MWKFQVARSSAEELWKWIQNVETLPETDFLGNPEPIRSTEEDLTLAGLLKKIEGY